MHSFVTDNTLTRRLASKARALIASRYEQSYVRRCLKEYYRQILDNV